jgi:UDP-hydrolysing UDP-N-acetyl-D-glucosamine 2-epimerase
MRKICVASGSRADYGHLFWLMKEIQMDSDLELQTLVTGMHLSDRFGMTVSDFEKDGFPVSAKVNSDLVDDSPEGVSQSMGVTMAEAARELKRLSPDIVVVLGDRYEMLSVAIAAHILRIPVAHIHGGESTEGLIDEAIRHSLTKFSNFHFVAAEAYRKTVIQLGESPERVFNFGAPGLDHLLRSEVQTLPELSKRLNFDLLKPYCVVVYHPETLAGGDEAANIRNLTNVLLETTKLNLLISESNSDPAGQSINLEIKEIEKRNPQRVRSFVSLGQKGYYGLLRNAEFLVGNSSSGIIDAPTLGVVSIDIGDRQRGRLKADSILSSRIDRLGKTLELLSDAKKRALRRDSPYGNGNASVRIKDTLKNASIDGILMKKFFRPEVT